jgi:hypothetical protein
MRVGTEGRDWREWCTKRIEMLKVIGEGERQIVVVVDEEG